MENLQRTIDTYAEDMLMQVKKTGISPNKISKIILDKGGLLYDNDDKKDWKKMICVIVEWKNGKTIFETSIAVQDNITAHMLVEALAERTNKKVVFIVEKI